MPANLTQAIVNRLEWTGKRQTMRDDQVRGLMIRLNQSGATYALQREMKGKTCLLTLGPTARHSLSDARKWARSQHVLFDKGVDPTARPEAASGVPTLGDVWDKRLAHMRGRKRPATIENYAHFRRYFADWMESPITGVSREMLMKRHSDMGAKPVLANRAMKAFRESWNWADSHLTPLGQCPLPKKDFMYPEKRKPKGLNSVELAAWDEAIAGKPREQMLLFALFSGLRRRTLLALEWDWIFWDRLHIPRDYMKSDRDFTVPLSRQLLLILHRVPKLDKERIFPFAGSRSKSVAHGHTLRHTYRTQGKAAGVPNAFLDALMDHKTGSLAAIYENDDALFDALAREQQRISDWLEQFVSL